MIESEPKFPLCESKSISVICEDVFAHLFTNSSLNGAVPAPAEPFCTECPITSFSFAELLIMNQFEKASSPPSPALCIFAIDVSLTLVPSAPPSIEKRLV